MTKKTSRRILWAALSQLIVFFLLFSCASAPNYPAMSTEEAYYDDWGDTAFTGEASAFNRSSSYEEPMEDALDQNAPEGASEPEERLRVFTGYASMEVRDLEETSSSIRQKVGGLGGYVELSRTNYLTVRVPAENFEEFFQWTLGLGRVLREEVGSYDVTDQFSDISTRLAIAQESRERLYQLLESSTDVEERVAILREIGRLSEQIEAYQSSLSSLENSIQFSRVDIELSSALDEPATQGQIPFPWIRDLAPGQFNIRGDLPELSLNFGSNFALLNEEKTLYAESARGVRIRVGATMNEPRGDLEFWHKALSYHYGPLFQEFSEIQLSERIKGIQVVSFDFEPYLYEVLVAVKDTQLIVFEIYYPTKEQYENTAEIAHSILEEVQL